ncbi:hypothetical protein BCR44DRAFT_60067 [Catenaria anguillulae PL171]|uniref:Uncharacterized protein n=1 Tax=Catenaria anguillulae PL171 TaxID=765915 RepID=A0A1Y2HYX0_9FUNG|nr:hypothetical protein BCR44DRAFT_60067 [Catenaria anguillulae PL171]
MSTRRRLLPRPSAAAAVARPSPAFVPDQLPPSPPLQRPQALPSPGSAVSGTPPAPSLGDGHHPAREHLSDSGMSSDASSDSDTFDEGDDDDDGDDAEDDDESSTHEVKSARKLYKQWQQFCDKQQAICDKLVDQAEAQARAHVASLPLHLLELYWRAIEQEEQAEEHAAANQSHMSPFTPRSSIRSRRPSVRITSTPLRPTAAYGGQASPSMIETGEFDPDLSTIIPVGPGRYVELNGTGEGVDLDQDQDQEQDGNGVGGGGLSALGLSAEERLAFTQGVHRLRTRLDRMMAEVNQEW